MENMFFIRNNNMYSYSKSKLPLSCYGCSAAVKGKIIYAFCTSVYNCCSVGSRRVALQQHNRCHKNIQEKWIFRLFLILINLKFFTGFTFLLMFTAVVSTLATFIGCMMYWWINIKDISFFLNIGDYFSFFVIFLLAASFVIL